jgi:chaperone protein EcpD
MFKPPHRARAGSLAACWALWAALASQAAHGALSIGATRIVYDGNVRSTSVLVRNPSGATYAAQTWVNTESDDTTTAVPFMPVPLLFRLDPGAEQLVRITGLPHDLPQDRESLFFFNVQEIPQLKPDPNAQPGNTLTLALRTRIKLFYRPTALAGDPHMRLGELHWRSESNGKELVVTNPTPYHFTFNYVEVKSANGSQRLGSPKMVAPLSQQRYQLKTPATGELTVTFRAINDYGGQSAPLDAKASPSP